MRRAALAVFVLAAAACGQTHATYRDLEQIGDTYARENTSALAADTCHAADHRDLIGLADTSINLANLPAGTRVLCFACAAPRMDTPGRLNVQIGANHTVTSLRCG